MVSERMWTLFLTCILISAAVTADTIRCQARDYGNGGTVCVCNSKSCDTAPTPKTPNNLDYFLYTTNKEGLRFSETSGKLTKTSALGENEIIVNSAEEYQQINGWGGAFTDATGINIVSLQGEARENLLKAYFSETGIKYNLCRVPIGGTDFSTHGYSYNDGEEDIDLVNFKLAEEDFNYKIPFIQQALNLTNNNLRLFASTWTAPKWMKTNAAYAGFGFLKTEMYQSWANYHLKFLEKYSEQGITFWGITTGNEPSLGYLPTAKINSIAWLASEMSTYVSKNLGPTIRNSKYADIKIMAIDDQRFFIPIYPAIMFANNITKEYIDGIAIHWYWDTRFPVDLITLTHNSWPDKFLLGTEACTGGTSKEPHVILGSWDRAEKYADNIIENINHWYTGWVDWNMALNLEGGPTYIENFVDSPIIVNAAANEFYKQPMYYAVGHFSNFVPRDSVRVFSSSFDSENVPVVAFKRPDGTKVLVISNKQEVSALVNVVDDSIGSTSISLSPKSITTMEY